MRRKWLGFPTQGRAPRGEPSAARLSRPKWSTHAARVGSAPPELAASPSARRVPLGPPPRPHSLFLRNRSSCSTAMALTQSRAACSSEYSVKAMTTRPEAQLTPFPPRQRTWRRHGRRFLRQPTRPKTRSEKLRSHLAKTRPTLTSARPVELRCPMQQPEVLNP